MNIFPVSTEKNHTVIVAEAGVNHNGSISVAKDMVKIAAESGADFVKFQTFKAENLVTTSAEKALYQKKQTDNSESQFEMIKKLELDRCFHEELLLTCQKENIQFLSTAFDHESIDLLVSLDVPLLKIPSGEITNLPYLRYIAHQKKPVVMSTGMSTLEEVRVATNILFQSGLEKENLVVLHCNTEYPTPMEDVNLNAMLTIQNELNVKIGYSDHTLGNEVAVAAVTLGASVIEKHFTLSRSLAGPDHAASLEPNELKSLVFAIRNIEKAIGNGVKHPSNSEKKNISVARKSIVAKTKIREKEYFSEKNMTIKRPGTGISPMQWDRLIGQKAKFNFEPDDLIRE